ncbi:MAG: hypothetical protein KDG50_11915 [Chromatiales bacterium]|nr:hypothetical protein [Chromatiales bacterium]
MHYQRQTFFRPAEFKRESSTLRADVYNALRLLLSRSQRDCVFVPIREMQFLAVITNDEVIFVDSQAYAVRDGEGGRMILVAWQKNQTPRPASLNESVPVDIVHYETAQDEVQRRLVGAFLGAMKLILERQHDAEPEPCAKVISISSAPRV